MKVLDLFCGTKSIANAFFARGHEAFAERENNASRNEDISQP